MADAVITYLPRRARPTVLPETWGFLTGEITIAGDYRTGGPSMPSNLSFKNMFSPLIKVFLTNNLGYMPDYDAVNEKILMYTAPNTEIVDTTTFPSTLTIGFLVFGYSTAIEEIKTVKRGVPR